MKCVYVVALFGLVALQLCNAAPAPEEEKKDEPVTVLVAETTSPAAVEVKSVQPSTDVSSVAVETTTVEEKKA